MKKITGVSRRNFIRQTSAGLGACIVGFTVPSCASANPSANRQMARKVSVASVDLKGLWPDKTRESRINTDYLRIKSVVSICIPCSYRDTGKIN